MAGISVQVKILNCYYMDNVEELYYHDWDFKKNETLRQKQKNRWH